MRIAASLAQYPPHSLVGAWITTHEFLRAAATAGHDVTVYAFRYHGADYDLDGVRVCSGRRGRTMIDDSIRRADVVVCHGPDLHAGTLGRPTVRLVHSPTDLAPLDGDALVVFNSVALSAITECSSPSIVLHPPVNPAEYATVGEGDLITIVGCSEAKGIRTAWRCAEQLRHRRFLGVKGHYGEQLRPRVANFDVWPTTPDMRSVYRRTKVLLMPSRAETWGRVGVEAMASGIPVIAHPTPGLVESLDSAGIFVDRADTARWASEIERLHDPDEWAVASGRSLRRSAELHPERDLAAFVTAIETVHQPQGVHA